MRTVPGSSQARRVNDAQPEVAAHSVLATVDAESPTIVLVGATHKPDVTDTRNSPALAVADRPVAHDATVRMRDPLADAHAGDLVSRCEGADAVVVFVPHAVALGELEARWDDVTTALRTSVILDATPGQAVALDRSPQR